MTDGRSATLYWDVPRRYVWITAPFLILVLGAASAPVLAQGVPNTYELRYGDPVDVSLEDLFNSPEVYEGRAVRTTGHLEPDVGGGRRSYLLREGGARVYVQPVADVAGNFNFDAARLLGGQLQVVGLFTRSGQPSQSGTRGVAGVIGFWRYLGPRKEPSNTEIEAPALSLEALLTTPERRDGQLVRVVGQFRGRNLYGDLPAKSERSRSDWVIKDDLYAVWVTGKKPKGSGWELDPGLKRDTGRWIEVVGRVQASAGVVYLDAVKVSLGKAPTPAAQAKAPEPPPERPKKPPVVVFALPLDGEREVPTTSRFVVQFSKDMDEESFKGHVQLRYAGRVRPGDKGFEGTILSYDGGRRALTVDPGDTLRPGRQIELLLLPGISDIEGLSLTPRSGPVEGEAVDVLRFRIAG